jgi:hypothetical protein
MNGRKHSEDLGADGKIILKLNWVVTPGSAMVGYQWCQNPEDLDLNHYRREILKTLH